MMKKFAQYSLILLALAFIIIGSSCNSSKNACSTTAVTTTASSADFYKKYSKILGVELTGLEDKKLIEEVAGWIGTPYVYGGESKTGTDCSGMVQTIYKDVYNIKLYRTAADIVKNCNLVKKKELKTGDLVFFKINNTKVSHVGIYIGHDKFIHASSKGVMVNGLSEKYYTKYFYSGGRIKDLK
jgi:murein DD-endopeptidase / murein LD-carboxypeptidase